MASARQPLAPCTSATLVLAAVLAAAPWTGGQTRVGGTAPAAQSTSATAAPAALDAAQLIDDLHTLAAPAMEGRRSGTPGNRRARQMILDRFTRLALEPVGGSYLQPFPLGGDGADRAPGAPEGVNVMALAPGSRDPHRVVLVSAHYDHVGMRRGQLYPGADDNASGVAALLATAAWFARHPPDSSVLFVAFDAEEPGLLGATHFVAHPPIPLDRILAVVNADMIGRGDRGTIVVAGTYHYPTLKPYVAGAAKGRRLRVVFGHDRPARDSGLEDWTESSDHGPFHRAGVPFLYFGVQNHGDYHKPSDTPDRIPREFFVEAAELILDTVRRLARSRAPEQGAFRTQ